MSRKPNTDRPSRRWSADRRPTRHDAAEVAAGRRAQLQRVAGNPSRPDRIDLSYIRRGGTASHPALDQWRAATAEAIKAALQIPQYKRCIAFSERPGYDGQQGINLIDFQAKVFTANGRRLPALETAVCSIAWNAWHEQYRSLNQSKEV